MTESINSVGRCDKVVISMSGGLDSTCLALYYLANGYRVKAFGFDYGQRHSVELKRLRNNVKWLSRQGWPIELQIINLRDVFSGSVCSMHAESGHEIPHGLYNEDNMRSTVEPNRNVIFSAIVFAKALNWAMKENDKVCISMGVHSGDHSQYPDTTPESVEACRHAYFVSNWESDRVVYDAPFVNLDKAEVLKRGLMAMDEMGFDIPEKERILKNTNTCYDPDKKGRSCGKCGSCTERAYAFFVNGWVDPAPSQISVEEQYEIGRKIWSSQPKDEGEHHPDTCHDGHAI